MPARPGLQALQAVVAFYWKQFEPSCEALCVGKCTGIEYHAKGKYCEAGTPPNND